MGSLPMQYENITNKHQGLRAWSCKGGNPVLETLVIILVILWLLGLVTSYTMGGLIHILLVVAIVVVLVRVIQGRR